MQVPTYTPEFKQQKLIAEGFDPVNTPQMDDRTFASTWDKGYREQNPMDAATRSYDRFDPSLTNKLEPVYDNHVQPFVSRLGRGAGNVMQSGYTPAAGGGALLGAGIGALLNFLRNRVSGEEGGYDSAAGLGALAGAGMGAYGHWNRANLQKQAFSLGGVDPLQAIQNDHSLSWSERQALVSAVQKLNSSDIQQLKRLLATAMGAGVGAIIMRFVASKGLMSTALGAILGGVIGNNMVSSPKRNSLNQYL